MYYHLVILSLDYVVVHKISIEIIYSLDVILFISTIFFYKNIKLHNLIERA